MDSCLKPFKVLFKLLPVSQALGTNTSKRKVLGSAQLIVFAVTARKIFSAADAALKENHFSVKDAPDRIHELLDVVVAFDGKDAQLAVILTAQVQKENELFFFNPWKLERFLIQNRAHSCVRTCSF